MTEENIARRDVMNNLAATSALPHEFEKDEKDMEFKVDYESSRVSQQQIPRFYNFKIS